MSDGRILRAARAFTVCHVPSAFETVKHHRVEIDGPLAAFFLNAADRCDNPEAPKELVSALVGFARAVEAQGWGMVPVDRGAAEAFAAVVEEVHGSGPVRNALSEGPLPFPKEPDLDVRICDGMPPAPGCSTPMRSAQIIAQSMQGPLRAPHHTVGEIAAVQEVAMAACGVLYLDSAELMRAAVLRAVLNTVVAMHPRARPVVFLAYRDLVGEALLKERTSAVLKRAGIGA